jgi:serine/threonine protein kinase
MKKMLELDPEKRPTARECIDELGLWNSDYEPPPIPTSGTAQQSRGLENGSRKSNYSGERTVIPGKRSYHPSRENNWLSSSSERDRTVKLPRKESDINDSQRSSRDMYPMSISRLESRMRRELEEAANSRGMAGTRG